MLEGGNKTGITVESEVSKGVVLITPIPPPHQYVQILRGGGQNCWDRGRLE